MNTPLRLDRTARDDPDRLEVVRVGNGALDLAFLPGLGGRLISLRCDGTEVLWRNPEYLDADLRTVRPRSVWAPLDGSMGSWANVGGSKTWPAPQGWSGPDEWPGPPDAVLDSGSWALDTHWSEADDELVLTLTSPGDRRSGLTVERRFWIPGSGAAFRQRSTFTNGSDRRIRWSIWEVCQVDTADFVTQDGGSVAIGSSGAVAPVSMVEADGRIPVGAWEAGFRRVGVADVVAKVGFADATGRIAFRRPDGAGVDLDFPVVAGEQYPDGGCQVEVWMQYPTAEPLGSLGNLHPSARLVELEVLSPLRTLEPGESAAQEIVWTARGPRAR